MSSFKQEQTETNPSDLVQEKPGHRKHKSVHALSPEPPDHSDNSGPPAPATAPLSTYFTSPPVRHWPESAIPQRSLFLGTAVLRGRPCLGQPHPVPHVLRIQCSVGGVCVKGRAPLLAPGGMGQRHFRDWPLGSDVSPSTWGAFLLGAQVVTQEYTNQDQGT